MAHLCMNIAWKKQSGIGKILSKNIHATILVSLYFQVLIHTFTEFLIDWVGPRKKTAPRIRRRPEKLSNPGYPKINGLKLIGYWWVSVNRFASLSSPCVLSVLTEISVQVQQQKRVEIHIFHVCDKIKCRNAYIF